MPWLARKIDRANWDPPSDGSFDADAITGCLRTNDNSMSVWRVASETDLDDVALALIAVNGRDMAESIDIVTISEEYITEQSVKKSPAEGNTLVEDMAGKHVDLTHLSYLNLGCIAEHIRERIAKSACRRYDKVGQLALLRKAIDANRLDPARLHKNIRQALT